MMRSRKTNAEIRQWYLERISHIRELNQQWMAAGLAARERAQEAWHFRHTARLEARAMMDPTEAELLRARDLAVYGYPDGPTFEYLVERGREIMTQLLEQALTEVYKLPPEKQDAIASAILEELEDEQRWQAAFAGSQDKLAKLARKVRQDIKAGRVKEMGFDEL
jgi:hypothetical protein